MSCCVRMLLVALALWLPAAPAAGQAPTRRGEQLVRDYFADQVGRIAAGCLADVRTLADWQAKRPEYRRQLLDMLGLWPLPAKTDLKAVVTGKVEAETFTVEKIHFQSRPGLYVTGNLYVPKGLAAPAPAVLYVCGHAGTTIDGVSYGHHVNYQHHPRWFAEHGYVCLIIDSLQYGEIPGIHHGTYKYDMWWWHTLGYTPAGVECWNGIRALDYLETRPEVDPQRIGVTGRSGGGAVSWWIAAADDRPACVVPVAGIADLRAHLVEGLEPRYRAGVISGHCDCMYMVNTHRWDFPLVAALCAPRPLMLGNSDADGIFPVPGFEHVADKVRDVYRLYGAADKFTVLKTTGPHQDTPELRLGAYSWMDRWLKNGGRPDEVVAEVERPRFSPQELKVFDRLPEDAVNGSVHETFVRPAVPRQPENPEVARAWWQGQRVEWLRRLHEEVFAGWAAEPPPLRVECAADLTNDGLQLQAFDFTSETAVRLRLWLLTDPGAARPERLVLHAVGDPEWHDLAETLGPDCAAALQVEGPAPEGTPAARARRAALAKQLRETGTGYAVLAPRGVGPTAWAKPGTREDYDVRRRFALIGQTLDGQRVWDVRRALAVLRGLPGYTRGTALDLEGKGDMAGVVLYAALFEPDVRRLNLADPPASHRRGPTLLNVQRILDMPQAVALAFPRPVVIAVGDPARAGDWDWPLRLQASLGGDYLKVRTVTPR